MKIDRKIIKVTCFLLLLLFYKVGFSQEITHITKASGKCVISNITPEQAEIKALNSAKKEALQKAGIKENVIDVSSLETYSTNDTSIQIYSSLSNIVLDGQVVDWKILNEKRYVDEYDNFIYEVEIDADVVKYRNKSDPNFKAAVTGIKSVYYVGELLTFKIRLSKSGFIYLFFMTGEEVSQLFPNYYEKEMLFEPNEDYIFPLNENIEYEMELSAKKDERNILLLVLTKKESDVIAKSSKELYKWLYMLEPNETFYNFFSINIIAN